MEDTVDKRNSPGTFGKLPPASWQGQHRLAVPFFSLCKRLQLAFPGNQSLLLIPQCPFYTALKDTSATLLPYLSPL